MEQIAVESALTIEHANEPNFVNGDFVFTGRHDDDGRVAVICWEAGSDSYGRVAVSCMGGWQ